MDRRTILTKTAKGLLEATGRSSDLSRDLRNILKEIDGKVSVSKLFDKLEKTPEPQLLEALKKLEKDGFVREFVSQQADAPAVRSPNPQPPKVQAPAKAGADLDFSSLPTAASRPSEGAKLQAQTQEIARQAAATRAQEAAAAIAKADAEAKARNEAAARARSEAEQKARLAAEAAAKAKADGEAKARNEAAARAKAEAEQKARLTAEAKAKAEAEARARAEAEAAAGARQEAERNLPREAEGDEVARQAAAARARLAAGRAKRETWVTEPGETEKYARREAEERARREAEERAGREAEEKARWQAEERIRREVEEKTRREAEERAWRETEERVRRDTEEKMRQERHERERAERIEAEVRARVEAEMHAKVEADARARVEAEMRANVEAEMGAKREAEERARREEEERARLEEDERRTREARARSLREAEEKARKEREEKARREEEGRRLWQEEERARREADENARAEARRKEDEEQALEDENKAKEETKARAKEEAEEAALARKEARARERSEADGRERQKAESVRAAIPGALRALRPTRNLIRPIALALFVLLLGAVAAMPFLPIDAAPYEKAAQEWLGQPVKIGSVGISLVPRPALKFDKVSIGTDAQMHIAAIRAIPELGSILDEQKLLKSVELEGAVVIPGDFLGAAVSGKGKGGSLRIERITAKGVKLDIPGLDLPAMDLDAALAPDGALQSVTLSSSELKLTAKLEPKGNRANIEISAGSMPLPIGADLALDEFLAKGTLTNSELVFNEFEARIFGGILQGNARLKWSNGWSLDGEIAVRQMDATRIAAPTLAGGRLEGKGVYAMSARAPDKLFGSARLEGNFTVQKGSVTNIDMTRVLQGSSPGGGTTLFSELSGGIVADANRIQIRQLRLAAGLMSAVGNLDVDAQKNLSGRLQIELRAQMTQARATLAISGTLNDPKFRRGN
jgi:hypothetical protein